MAKKKGHHPRTKSLPANVSAFINDHLADAQDIQKRYGIPAGIILAQSALETRWGARVVGNAYFGIKGHAPSGASASFTTHEVVNGQRVQIDDSFRAYTGYKDAAEDYARFITGQPQLRECYTRGTSSRCATMIAHRGYATDPHYAAKLHSMIHMYGLDHYDTRAAQ